MAVGRAIWGSLKTVLFVVRFKDIPALKKWRSAIMDTGLNVHECRILAIVESKKERQAMGDVSSVAFISEGDFSFLGQLKNEEAKEVLDSKFDALVAYEEIPKKIGKAIEKMSFRHDIGINTESESHKIVFNTKEGDPKDILNFIKTTLEKIA